MFMFEQELAFPNRGSNIKRIFLDSVDYFNFLGLTILFFFLPHHMAVKCESFLGYII